MRLPVSVGFDRSAGCWQLLQGSEVTPAEAASVKTKHFAKYIMNIEGRNRISRGSKEWCTLVEQAFSLKFHFYMVAI